MDNTEDDRSLPIFIGAAEAQAIAFQLNKVELPRPLTHDLFVNTLDALEYDIKRIEIYDIKEGTFFANIILIDNKGMDELTLDARPSDAIALAIRTESPIFVDEKVMDTAGRIFNDDETVASQRQMKTIKHKKEHSHINPLKKLEKSLQKAIEDERYEDAAKLRDEINTLKDSHTEN